MSAERPLLPPLLPTIDQAAESLDWALKCIALGECSGLQPHAPSKAKAEDTLGKLRELQVALGRRSA